MKKSNNDSLNNKYPSPPKLKDGEDKVKIIYIICAAIWFKDGKTYSPNLEMWKAD